jgi:glutaminyl-peptide cyclotransferase
LPNYTYEIVNTYPHDNGAFTQGLIFDDDTLYEGTGHYGRSSLRRVELRTGKVLQSVNLPHMYFGEGIALFKDRLYQLTWENGVCFVYDRKTFEKKGELEYTGEGWGLTHDGTYFIASDGTDTLRFLDSNTFKVVRRVKVTSAGGPISQLNELEYVEGEIYANVWHTDFIARIAPDTGKVVGWIDLRGLSKTAKVTDREDVLNGIAYDAKSKRLFVTGKHWSKLFEIRVVKK